MPRLRVGRPISESDTNGVAILSEGALSPDLPPFAVGMSALGFSADDYSLIAKVQTRLLSEVDALQPSMQQHGERIAELMSEEIVASGRAIPERDRSRLIRRAQSELLGFGPIDEFLNDQTVSEIMVNGPHQIWVERAGKLVETNARFHDNEHVRRIIDRIIAPLGRHCDETSPMVDGRLPDGSRVNIIIPPLCLNGPTLTIRKFSRKPLKAHDLVARGSASQELVDFLNICVTGKINIIVAGSTGSGKTTMLNVLSSFIPDDERIVTIENAAEIQLQQRHVVTLESRPPNLEGKGAIEMRDLVVNALRMRPDRIIVGECRAGETLDMLQAMNTGHDGSMTTLHANTPRDAIRRMETMVLMSGMDLPVRAIREQIASAVDLIIQLERLQDGSRRITHVSEVVGMENDVVTMSDLFTFQYQGIQDGRVIGRIQPTGIRPRFADRLLRQNLTLPAAIFRSTDIHHTPKDAI
jgi:pilus assembly protein CpaF